jgi:ABC-type antimicrobial peptide transport system permease subunit
VIETGITMMLALVLAYIFFEMMRGEALEYIGDKIDLNPTPLTYLGFIGFALFVGFVAGIVPALYFSKIAPLVALKGKEAKTSKRGGFPFRKAVITTQFMLSLGFIMAVMMVLSQYHYSTNYNLGFERENVLDVKLQYTDPQLLKNEFGKLSSVQMISMSSHPLSTGFHHGFTKISDYHTQSAGEPDSLETFSISIDENFISLMKLELLLGNNFTDNHLANERFIIINEEFAKALSPEDPSGAIDKVVTLPDNREVRIGGMVKNFHYDNLRNPIKSFYFEFNPEYFQFANIKLQSGTDTNGNLDQNEFKKMEKSWKKINATDPFLAQLLSDEIGNAYKYYFDIIKLWSFLGLMAITVSCLGLLGTVVFTIRTRVKEISLRKVMGASSENLVILLSKDFVIIMVIASIITIPVVWLVLGQMLSNMQYYSVKMGFFEVVVSISILFFIGLTTVLSQTLRAANMNPVDNLRVE